MAEKGLQSLCWACSRETKARACRTTIVSCTAAHASLKVWLCKHRVKLVGSQGLVGVFGHCGGNHKYHSSLGGLSSNYMNGSWRNCTQFVTSGNWKEKECDCQGTVCSVSRGETRQGSLSRKCCLTPGRMPAHRHSLPQGAALSPLVSLRIDSAFHVCRASQQGFRRREVCLSLQISAWFCGCSRYSIRILGQTTDNILYASLHVILVIKCLPNILLIIENYE